MTIALPNVVALVTGAAGGIGRELCKALKAAGATVVGTDLAENVSDIEADYYLQHDVTDPAAWKRVSDFISETYGRLDALVNNAGYSIVVKFEDSPLSEFHRVQQVNVDSIVIGVQTMLPLLKEGGKARKSGAAIVNFSSVGGQRGAAFNAAYCTSKAAVLMLSKCLGAEFAALGYNIRVNSVHPGGIDTAMLNSIIDRYVALGAVPSREAAVDGIRINHPIGRMGRPEELGGGVVYLCSEAASFVTCSELVIDGGFTAI
jgi:NAD(P)-dependent dehydrogenase (short-subunit alcohol dehydrogenase family)